MNIVDTYSEGPQDTPAISLAKRLEDLARYTFYSFMLKSLNLCRSEIGKLRSSLNDKAGRNRHTEAVLSHIDIDDVETLDSAVSSVLDAFHVRSNVPSPTHSSDFHVAR